MRAVCAGAVLLLLATPAAAQRGSLSSAVQVTLVAHKAASVGLVPLGAEALSAGLPPAASSRSSTPVDPRPGLIAHWNLTVEQVGDVRIRTMREAGVSGPSYIERRVPVTAPIARADAFLDPSTADGTAPSGVVTVRLVVY